MARLSSLRHGRWDLRPARRTRRLFCVQAVTTAPGFRGRILHQEGLAHGADFRRPRSTTITVLRWPRISRSIRGRAWGSAAHLLRRRVPRTRKRTSRPALGPTRQPRPSNQQNPRVNSIGQGPMPRIAGPPHGPAIWPGSVRRSFCAEEHQHKARSSNVRIADPRPADARRSSPIRLRKKGPRRAGARAGPQVGAREVAAGARRLCRAQNAREYRCVPAGTPVSFAPSGASLIRDGGVRGRAGGPRRRPVRGGRAVPRSRPPCPLVAHLGPDLLAHDVDGQVLLARPHAPIGPAVARGRALQRRPDLMDRALDVPPH